MKHFLTNCLYWVFSPILNQKKDGISLGRLLLLVSTLWCLQFAEMRPLIFGVLATYVILDKPTQRAVLLTLAGRLRRESKTDPKEVQTPSV